MTSRSSDIDMERTVEGIGDLLDYDLAGLGSAIPDTSQMAAP